MITAALAALPLISEAGQSIAKHLKQDLAGFLGVGQAGQNVPDAATSTAPVSSQAASGQAAASPLSFPALVQSFRHDAASLLLTAQGAAGSLAGASPATLAADLIQTINPNGDGTISKTQFESAFAGAAATIDGHGRHGGWAHAAAAFADHLFSAIDTNGDGSVTADELTAYLSQAQSQAAAKYKVAQNLLANFGSQLAGLATSGAPPTTPPTTTTSV